VIRSHPEAQPHVWGHHEEAGCSSSLGQGGVLAGLVDSLAVDAGDDGQGALHLVGDDPRHLGPLLGRQREHLSGVAVGDQTSDTAVASQPGRESAQLRFVDPEVRCEGTLHGRQDASVDPFRLAHG